MPELKRGEQKSCDGGMRGLYLGARGGRDRRGGGFWDAVAPGARVRHSRSLSVNLVWVNGVPRARQPSTFKVQGTAQRLRRLVNKLACHLHMTGSALSDCHFVRRRCANGSRPIFRGGTRRNEGTKKPNRNLMSLMAAVSGRSSQVVFRTELATLGRKNFTRKLRRVLAIRSFFSSSKSAHPPTMCRWG